MNALRRLIDCIRVLGWEIGLRYWDAQNQAIRNPQFALEWAENCIKEANRCAVRGEQQRAECFWGWADALKASHSNYTAKQFLEKMTLPTDRT